MRNVSVRQLEVFVAAARDASFARAAERLNLSPAGVSFQIKKLEGMTGLALFERVGRRAVLTEPGQALLAHATTIMQSLRNADQALAALNGVSGGRVRIGIVSTAKYIVPHMLARFQAEHRGVAIHLRDGNRREILEALARSEIDLAVSGRPPEEADVAAEAFAGHPSVLIAGAGHPLARSHRLTLSALADVPFIAREDGSGTRQMMDRTFQAANVRVSVAMTTSSNETIKQAVMAGMGIALISRHTVGLELALGLLKELPVDGTPVWRSWFAVHRRTMPLLPIHARLRDFLLQNGQAVIDDLGRVYAGTGVPAGRVAKRRRLGVD